MRARVATLALTAALAGTAAAQEVEVPRGDPSICLPAQESAGNVPGVRTSPDPSAGELGDLPISQPLGVGTFQVPATPDDPVVTLGDPRMQCLPAGYGDLQLPFAGPFGFTTPEEGRPPGRP